MTMNLASMLPFLDEEGLQILVDGLIDGSLTDISLGEILHFLEDEQIKELYNHYAAHPEKGVSTTIFFPFMDDDDVDKEFLRQFAAGKINNEILPFVSDEALHLRKSRIDNIERAHASPTDRHAFAPFPAAAILFVSRA